MRITKEIVDQINVLGGRDDDMTIFLQPLAWEQLQTENPLQFSAQTSPPTIFGVPIRVTTEAGTEVQAIAGA